jgi:Lrp/AsnC family leucine-responsive transcriptional regulator
VIAFVSLSLAREQFKQVRSVEKAIRQFPEILECYTISGDFDYLLKVAAADLKSLSSFLTDRLMQVPGVAGVRSMVCMEEIKPASPLPVPD